MRFLAGVEDADLRWFEEPVNADDLAAARRVRASTRTPIAAGESEATRFDFRELIANEAADVLQPDLAICGGPTEGRRIAALAETHQLELAPHCWGSALAFNAGVSLAFSSSAARTIEYSLGGNPLLREMPVAPPTVDGGVVPAPTAPGFGIEPRPDFLNGIRGDLMTNSIHHANVMVDDLAAAIESYGDVPGLERAETPDLGFPAQFLAVGQQQEIHVNELGDVHTERSHFCLRLDDFNAVFARALERGVFEKETWGGARRLPTGVMQAFVRDPAGNLIEISCESGQPVDPSIFEHDFVDASTE